MKISFAIFVILSLFTSCKKNKRNSLTGTWELKEVLMDPGNGSGVFSAVSSDKNLVFHTNGNVNSNGIICDMSIESNTSTSGTYSEIDSTIISTTCQNLVIKYEVNGDTLILIYPCFEACKAKYIKVL
ncbi:MAG: lipocalin family protein [Flavobacteriia bacterium]|nr:lipocalin family protein [Flavobacteriia bacterium]